jgi:hypothetical protein
MPIYANQDYSRDRLRTFKEEEETGLLNEFGKGFGAGVDQLQALAGGAKALVGSAVGNDDWFYEGMEYFDEQMAEAAENTAEVGRLEDIEGLGDFANYSAFIVGNIIPSLIGGGGVGAVGGAVAKKVAINQGAKALVKKNAEGLAKNAAKRQYAQSAVGREALGKVGLKGQLVGATAFGTVMGAGESFTRIFDETGEEAAGLALVTGLASGALDAMTPMRVLKRVLPQNMYSKAAGEVAENVSKKKSVITRALKEAGKASGTEGVTEMMQEIVQNSALEFVRGQQDPAIEEAFLERLFDEENQSQYLNAFVAGAIGGGAIGGVTGAVTKDPEAKQNLDKDALQEEATEQSQEEPSQDPDTQEVNPNIGGERVQAARAKAQDLPEGRSTIAPMTVEQAREKAQNLPERRDLEDPETRQVEARAKARAQVDGLPAVRERVKEIYQMELGALGETTRIPNEKPATSSEEASVFGGNLPESITPRMEELVGRDVDYNGNKGPVVKKDDGFYVATQDNGDVLIESGEYQSPEQLGVVPSDGNLVFENDVQIDDNNKFELRGKKYSLTRIIRDAEGNPLSLAVRDENGAKKTIRTPEVVARINNQKTPVPDFSQIIVELDDLPASIQKQVIQQSDPDNIPDSVPASQAIDIAQSMPNAEAVVEGIQEIATQSLTIPQGSMSDMPAVPYTENVTRPSVKPLAQAIADVNKSQGANRSPIDQGRIDSLFASPEVVMQNGNTVTVAEGVQADEIKHALVDLLGAGLPKRVMNYVSGFYSHTDSQMDRQVAGSYLKTSKAITLNSARVKELIADKDNSSDSAIELRFNLAHEIGHAFDVGTGHTTNSPDFSLEVDGMGMNSATYEMGPVIHELGQNYLSGTELGQELAYPFGPAFEWIANSEPQNIAGQVDRMQKEAFAQAFAIFHTSPELLQEQAPKTYKHLETLLRTQPTETIQNGEADIRTNEADGQPQEVQGDVRSPTQRGSTQVQEQEGSGGDGGSSLDAEQASQGLGEPTQREAGDGDGRAVQLEQTEPKVKRAADFENTGNYNVTYPDGTEYLIYRDTMQFANPMWHLSPEYYDILKLDFNAIQRTGGIGDNRKEALQWLNKAHSERLEKAEAEAVQQELGDIDDDYDPMDDLASFDDDALFIQRKDLSPEAQNITASGVLYGDEEIQVSGTSRNGAAVVVDLARAFDARVKEATGGKTLGEPNDDNSEVVSDLIAHEAVQAMKTDGNAGEWYQQKVANAMSLAAQEFPELTTDPNAKFAFTSIMAITSNGASVPENSVNTFEIYRSYRDSKVFPDFGVGKEAQAMKSSFALLNRLIQLEGIDSVRAFMDKDVTVKILKNDFGLSVSGELMGTKLKGSAILGPKIGGGFYQNLNGNFDPLTMDRWFMRTWGRLTGTLMADAERKLPVQLAKFREVALGSEYRSKLKADGIDRGQLASDDEYAKSYATKVQAAYANGGFKDKNTINKASNTFKNSQGEKQAPQNGKEREYIRSVMMLALDKVNQTSGSDPVNMGALQAIIWYPEKDLYKQLGVGNAKSEPTDYETEFQKIVEARSQRGSGLSRPDGTAQQSGAGRLERADGQDDQDTGQSTSRPNQQSNAEADQLDAPPRNPSDFVTAPTSTAAEIMSDDDLVASVRAGSDGSQIVSAVKDKDVKAAAGFAKSGFKKWFQKNFYSRGLLPETAFDSKIERDGEFGAVEMDIRQMVGLFDEAVQNNFGEIDASQAAVLDKAMQVPAAEVMASKLPNDIKEALVAMRNYIDKMSADYAEILNSDIEKLKSEGNDEALAKSELLSIVVNNMGKYANRSYRAFDDKNWNKEVPEEVILAARNFLVEQGTTNPDQVINTILKEGTAFDDMSSFIAESKLGAKDLSILKKKNNTIAPEIRALLGEYKDARINFAKSATKMSRLIYNDRFLNQVLKDGKGVFLFDQADAPVGATKKIAEVGSKTMTPLNGLYTFPEIEQAFRDALDKEQLGGLYKTVIQINGMVKYGKTVIAPTTMARNWMSASLFTVANGHFNWSKIGKSIDVTSSYRTGQGAGVEYLKRLKKLGVVHDNPYAGEMIDLLKDSNAEQWVSGTGVMKSFFDNATRFYQYGDDFWKIVGFENEIINFMENKGMSREEAEIKSAKRIRDTYPTYSLIGDLPQKLRRFPLAGTFVSFPAEIVRTQANMIKYLREDLADPDMRPAALKRIAGIGMVSAGVYAAQAMAMSAFGVSEEEEEAIKLMAAPWAKNSNILVTGRDDQGRLEYLDLTHLDPYALMKRPLNALLRDQPLDDAVVDAGVEILKPFLGWDISTNTILEFISNEKTSGGEVYNEADTLANKAIATYMHFERGMGPSVIQNGRRMEKALSGEISRGGKAYDVGDEMAAFIGFRKTTFDPKTALHFKAYEFSEGKRQSTRLLTSVFRDPNDVSDSDIREAFGRASTARRETFEDMAALVSAAMSSGLNATQTMTILRSNGVTKKDARALIDGGASAWTMSDSTLKNSISKSDVLFGKQKSKEFVDRWTLIQQLLNEELN